VTPAARSPDLAPRSTWYGKGRARAALLLAIAAVVAGIAAAFGIARDYGYLHASILSGSPGGYYYALASRLAGRAKRGHGVLTVVPSEGSIENVGRLTRGKGHCDEMFGLIQDGTPVTAAANLGLLGRLPNPESLLLVGKSGNAFRSFADLRGASIGIGPQESGTAYLMRQLFEDRGLDVHFSYHELPEQAELVSQGKLNLAAFVMEDDAELLHTIMRQGDLDIVAPSGARCALPVAQPRHNSSADSAINFMIHPSTHSLRSLTGSPMAPGRLTRIPAKRLAPAKRVRDLATRITTFHSTGSTPPKP
jgi:hypothetical protein